MFEESFFLFFAYFFIVGSVFGITGFLIASVLTQAGEILFFIPLVVRFVTLSKNKPIAKYNPIQYWIAKITYACGKCIAGFWCMIFVISNVGLDGLELHSISGVIQAIFLAYLLEQKI